MSFVLIFLILMDTGETSSGTDISLKGTFEKLGIDVASWLPATLTTFVRQRPIKSPPFRVPLPLIKFYWPSVWLLQMRRIWKRLSFFHHATRLLLRAGKGSLHPNVNDAEVENSFLIQGIVFIPCNYISSILCRQSMLSDPFSDHLLCQSHIAIVSAV